MKITAVRESDDNYRVLIDLRVPASLMMLLSLIDMVKPEVERTQAEFDKVRGDSVLYQSQYTLIEYCNVRDARNAARKNLDHYIEEAESMCRSIGISYQLAMTISREAVHV